MGSLMVFVYVLLFGSLSKHGAMTPLIQYLKL